MPLRGESRAYPTYSQLRQVPGGSNALIHIGFHVGYDLECVQKTYDRPGREDAVAFHEPRLLYELDHPNITKILDAQADGEREHAITMVMPCYPGGDLCRAIESGRRYSVGATVECMMQIGSALDCMHTGHTLVHRDVKPKNILIDESSQFVLCDFATAARLDANDEAGPVRATLPYQPPETAGRGRMGPPSDVYSLGLVGIEMLRGHFLYEGLHAATLQSRVDQGRRAYSDSALASRSMPPHVPARLRTLIRQCVAAEPASRPTAAQLVTSLGQLRVVDWRHVDGDGIDGRWLGTWPPRGRADRLIEIEVTSHILERGRAAGSRRLTCRYRRTKSGSWRSIGSKHAPIDLPDAQDAAAVSAFFKVVSNQVAHRFAT